MSKPVRSRPAGGNSDSVASIARGNTGLGTMLRRAESYIALNRHVRGRLPDSVRGEIGIARIDGECLVIAAASPARAAQARMLAASLLQAATEAWPTRLAQTRVIVVPGVRFD